MRGAFILGRAPCLSSPAASFLLGDNSLHRAKNAWHFPLALWGDLEFVERTDEIFHQGMERGRRDARAGGKPFMRLSAATRVTNSSTTAVMAALPPRPSWPGLAGMPEFPRRGGTWAFALPKRVRLWRDPIKILGPILF
jgi:hypothetical protein